MVLRKSVWHRDVIRDLVAGFNEMVEGLRDRERLKGELEVARKLEQAHAELQQVHEALKETQGQLIQAEKMAALGELVAGVAHELNNPVNYLVQSISLVREYVDRLVSWHETTCRALERGDKQVPPPDLTETLEELDTILGIMADGAERTAVIVRKLREFSRVGRPNVMARVALGRVIDACIDLLHFELKKGIRVHRRYEGTGEVEGDPAQFDQLFLNLLSNAVQAIDGEGDIWVHIRDDGPWVVVDIRDNGCGIPPEHLSRLFDPFFTTKEVGKGTGLGLSLCYRVVQRHGGVILVESTPGEGSTFTVRLPREARKAEDPGGTGVGQAEASRTPDASGTAGDAGSSEGGRTEDGPD